MTTLSLKSLNLMYIYIAVFSFIICYNIQYHVLSLTAKLYVIYNSYVFIIIMIMSHFNRVKNLCLYKRTISSGLNIPNCTFLTSLKGALESAVYAIVYNRRKTITRDFLSPKQYGEPQLWIKQRNLLAIYTFYNIRGLQI